MLLDPSVTARVKISQNVDILAKAVSCIVEGGQNDSENQSKMPLCAHLGQQSKQAVD